MAEIINIASELLCSIILFIIVMNYILTSRALYALAKKYKIRCPGYAWVPVASDWILGSITDKMEGDEDTRERWGKTLYSISMIAVCVILFVLIILVLVLLKARHVLFIREVTLVFSAFIYFMLLIFFVLLLARMAVATVCTYKIFEYADRKKAISYLLLSFIIPLANAVCLNRCKNKLYIEDVSASEEVSELSESAENTEETDTKFEEMD